jgi:16S rRNA (cytosine967-C5)-methyltransferase
MPAISPSRKEAFQILLAVERGKAHSDDLLRVKSVTSLSEPDRNLTTALVLGVLRWQIQLDHQIQAHLARPNARLDIEARIALRLGAFQLLHLDRIPARAAIDESVELTKQAGHQFASRMVNAVLRKLVGAPPTPIPDDSAVNLALSCAHPEWMVERWVRFYGLEATQQICRRDQEQPAQAIRILDPAIEAELTQQGITLAPGELLTGERTVASGDLTSAAVFREGHVRMQDEGSQLVAEIAGRGNEILDCCAAPGGKTLILAERNPAARIVACEASPQRLSQLRERLTQHEQRIECRLADATSLEDDGLYDLVLADVPCSGTGTLGRNPEIRHRLQLDDLARQAERQLAILRGALQAACPGGRVVYSTCSLEPEENERVVNHVLASAPDVRLTPMHDRIDEMLRDEIVTSPGAERLHQCVTPEGFLRLLPGRLRTDGFFIALLEKSSGGA